MKEYLIENPIAAVVFIVIAVVVAVFLLVKVMQTVGMEKVRKIVYKAFVVAENKFQHGDNVEKFNFVINVAKDTIPTPFNLFITESLLRKVIQAWFDLCKDLLDDGRLNGSKEKEE